MTKIEVNESLLETLGEYLKNLFRVEISLPSLRLIFKDCDIDMASLAVWPEVEISVALEVQLEQWFFMRFIGRPPQIDSINLTLHPDDLALLDRVIRDPNWKRKLHSPHALGFKPTETDR
ncbi:hypothetical protein [Alteromonas sp. 14N.309.X.WAT.G.H12]|uniref:hypothetical protein n=1 Tax=Alteromonas sp. 14N.309.X.WAT.G.H12 TaxID=3120824 RepID=UPI002FD10235